MIGEALPLLDLRKEIVLNLKKNAGIEHQKAQVVLALDFSGSMDSLYKNGAVQQLLERILPLGLAFDDNNEIDLYLFHDGVIKMPKTVTRHNLQGFVKDTILGKYAMGGTRFAPVLSKIVRDFGGNPDNIGPSKTVKKESIFSSLFGKKKEEVITESVVAKKFDLPVYVIFITDGENGDHMESELVIKAASKYGIFFQFIGIGTQTFTFLRHLDTMTGRLVDNANFFTVKDLSSKTDQELYDLLLKEFPHWTGEVKALGLIN